MNNKLNCIKIWRGPIQNGRGNSTTKKHLWGELLAMYSMWVYHSISSFRFILEVLPPRKLITYSLSKSVLTCDVFYFLLQWSLFKGQMYKFVHFQRPKIPYPLFSFGVLTFGNRRSTFCWTIHSLLQATCMRWRADTGDTTLHEFPCFFPGFEGYLLCNVSNCVSLASKWCFGWHIQGSHIPVMFSVITIGGYAVRC